MLGDNLLTLIKRHNYEGMLISKYVVYHYEKKIHLITGIPVSTVKILVRDIVHGLFFLHDKCKIIHTGNLLGF